MKGKIGLVVGLGAGYVLGTRAGRQRYEQIKTQWLKLWNQDPVQNQITRVQEFAKAQVAAVPGALWTGAVKVVKAASNPGTPEQRLQSAKTAAKDAAEDVAETAKDAAADAKRSADAQTRENTDAGDASSTTGDADAKKTSGAK